MANSDTQADLASFTDAADSDGGIVSDDWESVAVDEVVAFQESTADTSPDGIIIEDSPDTADTSPDGIVIEPSPEEGTSDTVESDPSMGDPFVEGFTDQPAPNTVEDTTDRFDWADLVAFDATVASLQAELERTG